MSNTINNLSMGITDNYNSSNTVSNSSLEDSQLFLKMLSVSLVNQDPMNPQDSSEYLNQITQYAVIETLTTVRSEIKSLTNLQLATNMNLVMSNATAAVGKEVTILLPEGTDGNKEETRITGVVDKVQLKEDGIYLVVDGKEYEYVYLETINK